MTTTEAIAATIATHTPIGARYQLVAVPGTELTDACTNCGGAHHVQQCPELRAALGRFDADSTIAWLREELNEAHQHIGALTQGGLVTFAAAMMLRQLVRNGLIKNEYTADEARIAVDYFEQGSFGPALADARAWLRREAK